jgi:membrane protease YdiL (CAAX protease family)
MISKTFAITGFQNRFIALVLAMIAAHCAHFLTASSFGLSQHDSSNLIFSTLFLLACAGTIRLLRLSAEDVGLRILRPRLAGHVGLCLALLLLYGLYYLFVVRISGLRPITSAMIWGLLNCLVVPFAEEIYFRGLFYHIIEKRFSGRAAILVSGLLFGLVHYSQGLGMLPKFFTGWLWGSVRNATGMIFLLIPLHFIFNAVWLLFEGKWDNPPALSFLFPLVELLLAIVIVLAVRKRQATQLPGSEDYPGNSTSPPTAADSSGLAWRHK